MKMAGVTGVYSYAFDELETMLTEVKEILKSGSITNDELRGVRSEIDRISFSLKQVFRSPCSNRPPNFVSNHRESSTDHRQP